MFYVLVHVKLPGPSSPGQHRASKSREENVPPRGSGGSLPKDLCAYCASSMGAFPRPQPHGYSVQTVHQPNLKTNVLTSWGGTVCKHKPQLPSPLTFQSTATAWQ